MQVAAMHHRRRSAEAGAESIVQSSRPPFWAAVQVDALQRVIRQVWPRGPARIR